MSKGLSIKNVNLYRRFIATVFDLDSFPPGTKFYLRPDGNLYIEMPNLIYYRDTSILYGFDSDEDDEYINSKHQEFSPDNGHCIGFKNGTNKIFEFDKYKEYSQFGPNGKRNTKNKNINSNNELKMGYEFWFDGERIYAYEEGEAFTYVMTTLKVIPNQAFKTFANSVLIFEIGNDDYTVIRGNPIRMTYTTVLNDCLGKPEDHVFFTRALRRNDSDYIFIDKDKYSDHSKEECEYGDKVGDYAPKNYVLRKLKPKYMSEDVQEKVRKQVGSVYKTGTYYIENEDRFAVHNTLNNNLHDFFNTQYINEYDRRYDYLIPIDMLEELEDERREEEWNERNVEGYESNKFLIIEKRNRILDDIRSDFKENEAKRRGYTIEQMEKRRADYNRYINEKNGIKTTSEDIHNKLVSNLRNSLNKSSNKSSHRSFRKSSSRSSTRSSTRSSSQKERNEMFSLSQYNTTLRKNDDNEIFANMEIEPNNNIDNCLNNCIDNNIDNNINNNIDNNDDTNGEHRIRYSIPPERPRLGVESNNDHSIVNEHYNDRIDSGSKEKRKKRTKRNTRRTETDSIRLDSGIMANTLKRNNNRMSGFIENGHLHEFVRPLPSNFNDPSNFPFTLTGNIDSNTIEAIPPSQQQFFVQTFPNIDVNNYGVPNNVLGNYANNNVNIYPTNTSLGIQVPMNAQPTTLVYTPMGDSYMTSVVPNNVINDAFHYNPQNITVFNVDFDNQYDIQDDIQRALGMNMYDNVNNRIHDNLNQTTYDITHTVNVGTAQNPIHLDNSSSDNAYNMPRGNANNINANQLNVQSNSNVLNTVGNQFNFDNFGNNLDNVNDNDDSPNNNFIGFGKS